MKHVFTTWHQIQILQKFKIRLIYDTRAHFNLVSFGAMLSITSRKTTVKHKTLLCIFSISLCRDSVKSDQKALKP